ncbi:hypothetical protein [Mucilaginibacter myungsuensis]|uniref:Uncharacterized protein n=1 Tax=Mucilaginibacter myungsuensis TaxID=649104 RepID=A0A929KYW8_9SPHI|nr:hypothetical protein [Mucilaginibacter myungsuensis]MBE9661424.1 hypothetical protein [Mucilaginibacter myungsuensis]MDN3597567.1 hypothetical protein [Mucilaginibacter myungsuensis]
MKTLLLSIFCCTVLHVSAQKLPTVQKANIHAPAQVKTDGKATEWGPLRAYNKATNIFYTVANDQQRLYLTVQASDRKIITKIVNGGLAFSVNKSSKKLDADAMTICYPMFDKKNRPQLDLDGETSTAANPQELSRKVDSIAALNNDRMVAKMKWIKVNGISGLDTVSIYNEDGIKAVSLIDSKMVYTYELAIDLKNLGLSPVKGQKFYYNIKLNGIPQNETPGMSVATGPDGETTAFVVTNPRLALGYTESWTPTDLWGEYQLVGK